MIFKSERGARFWSELIEYLEVKGHDILDHPEKCDVSIVLSGRFENPNCFYGKKILLFNRQEWTGGLDYFFHRILEKYYDDIIDVTKRNFGEILTIIENA